MEFVPRGPWNGGRGHIGCVDALEETVKIYKIAGPYKDANFHFVVGGVDHVGVSGMVLRVEPCFVGSRIHEVIMILRITPVKAEPRMTSIA